MALVLRVVSLVCKVVFVQDRIIRAIEIVVDIKMRVSQRLLGTVVRSIGGVCKLS